MKWKAKNRIKVILSTENPPLILLTKLVTMGRMAKMQFGITFSPQKDI